jgi:hypothetical protein
MTTVQQALQNIELGKQRFAARAGKNAEVLAVREGRWEDVAPGFFPEDIPEPMVANFIDVAARAAAEMIAPLPSFTCSNPNMSTDAARKSADKRTKIVNHYVAHSNLGEQNVLAADHLDSYGSTAYIVEPDFEARTPCVYVESAIGALYALDRKGRTVWYARVFRRSIDELMYEYEEYEAKWAEARNSGSSYVEVVRYYGKDVDMLLVPELKLDLHVLKNPISRCRVRVVEAPKTGEATRGAYDDAIWIQLARAKFGNLTMRIAEDVANAPTAVPDDVQNFEVGPNAVIKTANPQNVRRVDLSVPNQPFAELQNLAGELRTGARYSELRDGNTDASIITGKGVQALLAGSDNRIKTLQGRIATGLTDIISMCFEMDEILWGKREKSVNGLQDGAPYEMKYKPARDIDGNWTCSVSYGLTAGLDPNRALVFLLQLQTAGDISRDTVMRQIPFELDVVAEQKKIYVENIRDAMMGGIAALPQAIPAMAMQGADPTELLAKVAAVVQALQKGQAIEDAVEKAFPPAPPPPQPSPEEAAAGGAVPPEDPMAALGGGPGGPAGAPPGAASPVQDLMMAMAGTGPTGSPNLSFGVSRRREV